MSKYLWWQKGTIYQIYPRSFLDTNGDGIGDLEGIRRRLPYLRKLGIDAIWVSPFYPSPMAVFGYDVANYVDVHPLFGTLDGFRQLLADAHAADIRIIIDLVPNHTSAEHPWFIESRASKDNPRRDWYIWRDPAPDGGPPNNWLSVFGGSGWEFDTQTGQYYYHAFLKEQPDLNWRNPEVQQAMLGVMKFWLDLGVDGFRVDVMWHMIKDAQFRENPPNPHYRPGIDPPYNALLPVYSTDQPEVHECVEMMRRLTDRYDERLIIGEVYLPVPELMRYYGTNGSGAHLPFNFQLVTMPWNAEQIYAAMTEYDASLPSDGWPNWVLGNHDQPRIASRVGAAQARVAAMLLLALRGTPTIYYGDEIGMQDVFIHPSQYRDPQGKNIGISRDPARTPMQWDDTTNAGFTTGEPWLPLGGDYATVNVAAEQDDRASMLVFYHDLLALRRAEPALNVGTYVPIGVHGSLLAFAREADGRRFLVALNLGDTPAQMVPDRAHVCGRIVLASNRGREGQHMDDEIALEPNEGVIILCE
jgi:alpha-glucosidase